MKKMITLVITFLLLIPLADAFWYKDIEVEKNISQTLIAGSTDNIIISFKNPMHFMGSLLVRLNMTEYTEDYPVWLGDFKVRAVLNSTTIYPGHTSSMSKMDCVEQSSGVFYCFNLTDITMKKCFTFDKRGFCWIKGKIGYIVLPKSVNNLTLYVDLNPALIPANYNFKVDLFNELRIPRIKDPVKNTTIENEPTLFNISDVDTILWVTANENKTLLIDVIIYEFLMEEEFVPIGLIPIKFIGIEANDTESITSVDIRIYYNESEIFDWLDESSLKMYYYNENDENPEKWKWELVATSGINTEEKYVWATTNHLSLFGIFGYPKEKIVTVYRGGGTNYVYRNVTQNITKEVVKEVPAKPVCGNGICEAGEAETCPSDCKPARICVPDVKVCAGDDLMQCSSGGSEWNMIETCEYGCSDNECNEKPEVSGPLTGFITGAESPLIFGVLIAIAVVIGGLFYRARKRKVSK